MNKPSIVMPSLRRFKERAKAIKKETCISQAEALEITSKEQGFSSWRACKKYYDERALLDKKTPVPSLNYIEDGDTQMVDGDYVDYDNERNEDYPLETKNFIEKNKKQLAKLGVEYSVFEPTITGLKKSILDATHSVRLHFELENFHFYWRQGQGTEHKVMKEAVLLTPTESIPTVVSLYRPVTKKGDPRMWFRKLSQLAEAGDQVAIILSKGIPYLINLSCVDLTTLMRISDKPLGVSEIRPTYTHGSENKIKNFFDSYIESRSEIAKELLAKLKELAKTPFKALRTGDTAIGFTLEALLGIDANSSKLPDYKGIELKSGRGNKTRTTLFAQVADWSISPCKRSADILNLYGYERESDFKLYCTVSTQKSNSQGLSFKYDKDTDELQEWFDNKELVAVWPGELLRRRLKEKHSETFWVEAKSNIIDGIEHFHLVSVTHTRSPLTSQIMPLIENGVITMDHLIKRSAKNNRVSEKGPLFKMNKRDLDLLFPAPMKYKL